jgi:hypothetical protein
MRKHEDNIENSDFDSLLEIARELEDSEDELTIKRDVEILFEKIEALLKLKLIDKVNILYAKMRETNCLARIESLKKILETILYENTLPIGDNDDTHYANAVLPLNRGIEIAFSEGQAPGTVKTVIGFGKTMVGFKQDHISVQEIDFPESEIRDARERKFLCRHVSGNLTREDIVCIVFRIPFNFTPERYLNEDEKNRKPKFIFRGIFTQKTA